MDIYSKCITTLTESLSFIDKSSKMKMVQSLWNITATPNVSVSSLATTAPSILQGTRSVACSQSWSTAQVKEPPEVPHSSLPVTVPKFPSRGAEENGVYSGPFLSHSQDLGSMCALELRLQTAPVTAVCSTLWTQPGRISQNGKNNWFIHCQRIS